MNAKTKSIAVILGTLLVGVIIGSLATGAIFSNRVAEIQALRKENGMSRFLERMIEPTDEAQQAEIQAVLRETERRHMEIRRSVALEHRDVFVDMRRSLDQILNDDQKAALSQRVEKDRKRRKGFMRGDGPSRFGGPPFDSTRARKPFGRRGLNKDSLRSMRVYADSTGS
ncbi:MAG: hypothetical protein AAF564_06725 [Bacteroidota bacterium]